MKYKANTKVTVTRPGQTPFTGVVEHIHSAPGYVTIRDDRYRAVTSYPENFVKANAPEKI